MPDNIDVQPGGNPPNNQLAEITQSNGGIPQPLLTQTTLKRPDVIQTPDQALWSAIRNRTDAIGFDNYQFFINRVLCVKDPEPEEGKSVSGEAIGDEGIAVCSTETNHVAGKIGAPSIYDRRDDLLAVPSVYGVDAYSLLKLATQAFLLFETGVAVNLPRNPSTGNPVGDLTDLVPGEEGRLGERVNFNQIRERLNNYLGSTLPGGARLPYLRRIVNALVSTNEQQLPYREYLLRNRFSCPSLLELIWSYWNEEGMLVQTMNAICLRFQNKRGPAENDPLANLEIDSLRPLNNLLWGFIQDEYNRLTVPRRAYEYDHHYGLRLQGKAVPELRSADSRSKFVEAFHNLLYRASSFYHEDSDTTVIADGFPLLNSLREVHLLLAEGAHNQFGDLPWTARAEMLTMQWMLARPEMREFLRGRAAVPYQEPWMGQVDTMKKLQSWTDTSITHFRNMAVFGERVILSVRYGDWSVINDQEHAKNWARYWRPEIQNYIHAYHTATGVDLSEDIVDTRRAATRYVQPSTLLRGRLVTQGSRGSLPAPVREALPAGSISSPALPVPRRRALNPARLSGKS
jgi:hypothetical protein